MSAPAPPTKRYEARQYTARDGEPPRGVFIIDNESGHTRPVVEFHIGPGHNMATQTRRLIEYMNFLNMQDDAMKKAAGEITIASAVAQRMTKTP